MLKNYLHFIQVRYHRLDANSDNKKTFNGAAKKLQNSGKLLATKNYTKKIQLKKVPVNQILWSVNSTDPERPANFPDNPMVNEDHTLRVQQKLIGVESVITSRTLANV